MAVAIGRWLRLGHGNAWSQEQREDFIVGHVQEFSDLPFGLVMGAIAEARRKVEFADRFTKWVIESIADSVERLRVEEQRLARLAEIAGS